MSEEPLKHEIATLKERIAMLEKLLEAHERSSREQTKQLDEAMREARERTEQLARSEDELRRQASIFKLVLDSMADGVAVVDEKGDLLLRNPAAERMLGRVHLGMASADALPLDEPTLFFPDQETPWPATEHPLVRSLRGDTVEQVEIFIKRPAESDVRKPAGVSTLPLRTIAPGPMTSSEDAEPRSVRAPPMVDARGDASPTSGLFVTVTATPMRRKDGAISGAVAVFRDATERKRLIEDLEAKNRDLIESESAKTELVERLRYAIDEVSTPILELWDDILALPVIGVVDARRSTQIMERLLDEIVRRQSRYVIIDVTGVERIDTRTADHFMKLIKAVELLGARCRLTGVRPAVAQTMVELGINLGSVRAARNLKHALRESLASAAGKKPSLASLTGARRGSAAKGQRGAGDSPSESDNLLELLGQSSPDATLQTQLSVRKETSS
jgi:rsbT co-antagonist protein RsbR